MSLCQRKEIPNPSQVEEMAYDGLTQVKSLNTKDPLEVA